MLDFFRWLFSEKETNWLNERNLELFSAALAWGHYLYERDFGVNDLKNKIENYEAYHSVKIEVYKKLLIISLHDGCVQIEPERKEFKLAEPLPEDLHDVGGIYDRSYEIPVFKVKQSTERLYYVADSPSCLQTVMQMQTIGKGLKIPEEMRIKFYNRFACWLNYLIKNDRDCRDMIEICCLDSEKWTDGFVKRCYVELPNTCQPPSISFNGIGEVLANQFLFNYLLHIARTLPDRMKKWEEEQRRKLFSKLIILVPFSGYVRRKLDEKFQEKNICVGSEMSTMKLPIGLQNRKYKNTVYVIKGNYYMVEYATPVRQMYNMFEHRLCRDSFTEKILHTEIQNFYKTLCQLIQDHDLSHLFEVKFFDDDKITELTSLLEHENVV